MIDTTVDSLIYPDLLMCQPKNGFRFGIDSLVLAWFARIKKNENIVDIGSGSGVLSVLLARMKNARDITAVEMQDEMFLCLEKTVELNLLENVIKPVKADVRLYKPERRFNAAICNPPYRNAGTGETSAGQIDKIARFDDTLSISDLLAFCKKNLFFGGRLAISGDADCLVNAVYQCREYGFEPKRLMFMHPSLNKSASIYLMECVYGAGVELSVEPPLFQGDNPEYNAILKGDW